MRIVFPRTMEMTLRPADGDLLRLEHHERFEPDELSDAELAETVRLIRQVAEQTRQYEATVTVDADGRGLTATYVATRGVIANIIVGEFFGQSSVAKMRLVDLIMSGAVGGG